MSGPDNDPTAELALAPALIVEDDSRAQQRLADILAILGVANDAIHRADDLAQAEQRLAAQQFALVLVDIELPDGNGIDLIQRLSEHDTRPAAIVVSTFATQDLILAALRAGAVGYLLKERDDEELTAALRSIQRGGAPIDPFVARHILHLVAHAPAPTEAAPPRRNEQDLAEPLTRREEEILHFVAQGLISREIAEKLSRSTLTVEGHIKSIFRKLQVHTRTKAIHQARALGLLR